MLVAAEPVVRMCTQLAPWTSMLVIAAPLPTIRQIQRHGCVGDLPLLPYSSMLSYKFLWTTYGLLKQDPTLWAANGIGFFFSLYYWKKFVKHERLPGRPQQHFQAVGLLMLSTLLVCLSSVTHPAGASKQIVGAMALTICIAMFASPLAVVKTVLQTQSAKSIPLPFTLASTLNCFTWTVSGLLDMQDPMVWVGSLMGLFFAMTQVALKFAFGNGPSSSALPI